MQAELIEANDGKIYYNSDPYMDKGSCMTMGNNTFFAYLLHSELTVKEILLIKSFGFPIWNGHKVELKARPIPRHYNSLSTIIFTDSYCKYTGHMSGIWKVYRSS